MKTIIILILVGVLVFTSLVSIYQYYTINDLKEYNASIEAQLKRCQVDDLAKFTEDNNNKLDKYKALLKFIDMDDLRELRKDKKAKAYIYLSNSDYHKMDMVKEELFLINDEIINKDIETKNIEQMIKDLGDSFD